MFSEMAGECTFGLTSVQEPTRQSRLSAFQEFIHMTTDVATATEMYEEDPLGDGGTSLTGV